MNAPIKTTHRSQAWRGAVVVMAFLLPCLLRAESLIQPVDPAQLLQALPTVPPEWKCIQSTGRCYVSLLNMPISEAIRQYEIPSKQIPGTPVKPPGILKIAVVDSGSMDYSDGSDISPTSPGSFNANGLEGTLVGASGARKIFGANLGKRLSVDVESSNIDTDEFQKILQTLKFSALIAMEGKLPTNLLPPDRSYTQIENKKNVRYEFWNFHGNHLDELNPSNAGTFTTPIVRYAK